MVTHTQLLGWVHQLPRSRRADYMALLDTVGDPVTWYEHTAHCWHCRMPVGYCKIGCNCDECIVTFCNAYADALRGLPTRQLTFADYDKALHTVIVAMGVIRPDVTNVTRRNDTPHDTL